ncbi:MAG: hypothetical protein HS117_07745 [Verrucomicrobiaceae bacterium]|nr:hypothetical protein [Verrucomicrobiaceae bacterium]
MPHSSRAFLKRGCGCLFLLAGLGLATLLLRGCDSTPVGVEPAKTELVGVWECTEFSARFLQQLGIPPGTLTSRIEIREDGGCAATKFPVDEPYRLVELPSPGWRLVDPSMTPSGTWSLELDGHFLNCRRDGETLVLRHPFGVLAGYRIDFRRKAATAT